MILFFNHPETVPGIDAPGAIEDAVSPQCHPAVSNRTRKADAGGYQGIADATALKSRLHVQQAQSRNLIALVSEEYRTGDLAVDLRHPALLASRLEIAQERGGHLSFVHFDAAVPPISVAVQDGLAGGDESHVAGPERSYPEWRRLPALQQFTHRIESRGQAAASGLIQALKASLYCCTLSLIEFFEFGAAFRSQMNQTSAAVNVMSHAPDPSATLKTPKHPTDEPRIQIQRPLDVIREARFPLRNFEEDPRFGQCQAGVKKVTVQCTDVSCEEPVERADRSNGILHHPIVRPLVALVN